MDALKDLEDKVARVAKEMAALRKQNRSLSSQVKRLKRQDQSAASNDSKEWAAERTEIRKRARRLASTLESLLD